MITPSIDIWVLFTPLIHHWDPLRFTLFQLVLLLVRVYNCSCSCFNLPIGASLDLGFFWEDTNREFWFQIRFRLPGVSQYTVHRSYQGKIECYVQRTFFLVSNPSEGDQFSTSVTSESELAKNSRHLHEWAGCQWKRVRTIEPFQTLRVS